MKVKLVCTDPELSKDPEVARWLEGFSELMQEAVDKAFVNAICYGSTELYVFPNNKDHHETPARTPPAADARVGESPVFTDSLRERGFFGER